MCEIWGLLMKWRFSFALDSSLFSQTKFKASQILCLLFYLLPYRNHKYFNSFGISKCNRRILVRRLSTIFAFTIFSSRNPNDTNLATGLPFIYSLWTDLLQFKGQLCMREKSRNTHFIASHIKHFISIFNPFHATGLFRYPLKTSENL